MNRDDLEAAVSVHGLVLRGGFAPAVEDAVPDIRSGEPAATLVLFGNAGSSIWTAFTSSPECRDGLPDPMDRWSSRVGGEMAGVLGGRALFPFGGPPWLPFMRWAAKAEGLRSSALGMLMHPEYGLWHAYRLAIALPGNVTGLAAPDDGAHACDSCQAKPCLHACPVNAFDGTRYDVDACFDYLASHPDAPCHRGCLARHACPEGVGYRYYESHAAFHMARFFEARRARRSAGNG